MEQFNLSDATVPSFKETPGDGDSTTGTNDAFVKFILAVEGIICVVGLAGNVLVVIVLLCMPSLRSTTSDFLVHLSVVDFLVCVLVIPFFLLPKSDPTPDPSPLGEFWCRFYLSEFWFWFFTMTSVLGLTAVNLERYVAIVYPHKYKTLFNKRNKYIILAACWVIAFVTRLYIFFTFEVDEFKGCHKNHWSSQGAQAAFGLYSFTINFFAPFIVMIFAQLKVISKLDKQVKMLTARTASSGVNPSDQRKMWQLKASQTLGKTLLACVITFGVCWFPNQVWFLLFNFLIPVAPGGTVHLLTVILALGNSCVNPIIYTMTNKPFRKGIRKLFCRQRDSNQVGDAVATGTVSETISTAQNL